jgi:hypothetical protein
MLNAQPVTVITEMPAVNVAILIRTNVCLAMICRAKLENTGWTDRPLAVGKAVRPLTDKE